MPLRQILDSNYPYSVWWNLLLITAGSVIFAVGVKTIALHHNFLVGGLFGTSLLIYYATDTLSPALWNALLNIPLFLVAWAFVSRRFVWYSLYGVMVVTLAFELVSGDLGFQNQLYAAVASGIICGVGAGIILRSLGSAGGLDVMAVLLFQRYNIGVGKFYTAFNGLLFAFSFTTMEPDLVLASLILVFITSVVTDYMLSLFSQRKMVLVISNKSEEIVTDIRDRLKLGATILQGTGGYSRQPRNVLMTVINNIQLKRLEQSVFSIDENALFIVENTFNVLGSTFSKRKIY